MGDCEVLVNISREPLDLVLLNQHMQTGGGESGATVIFTGSVRVSAEEHGLTGMTLEHYPGMTEHQLQGIIEAARCRWKLSRVFVVHRVGYLKAGEPIVYIGVCALHRAEAFNASQFIMDYLKQRATFWKKEHYGEQSTWVDAKNSDCLAANRWEK